MPKKDSRTKSLSPEKLKELRAKNPDINIPEENIFLEGGFNAQLDKAIEKKELTIKDVKKALKIKDADIAEMFDFKNVMAYRNSSAKPRIEKGVLLIFKLLKIVIFIFMSFKSNSQNLSNKTYQTLYIEVFHNNDNLGRATGFITKKTRITI